MEEKSLFDRNIELLRKNYPRLAELVEACPDTATEELDCQIVNGKQSTVTVNGIQLTSRHDVVLQMEQMCAELNPAITTVDVYGHGLGDLGNYLLDNFKQLNQINFHILNLALFKILLSVVDFPLDNPKIRWIYENDQWEVKVPNVIYYPEVLMCDEQNRMLAEHLEGYLDLSYAMDSFAEEKARIIEQIRHNISYIKNGQDVTKLFNSAKGKKAVVIAPGPSLEQSVDKLRLLAAEPDHVFIAVDTASKFMHENNIRIDYLVSIDSRITTDVICTEVGKDEKLVYSPSIPESFIKLFDKRYIFYCDSSMYKQFDEIKRHGRLYSSGTVAHCAVDLAVRMGMSDVVLFGFDFAFSEEARHAGYDSKLGKLLMILDESDEVEVKGTNGKILKTSKNFRYYRQDLELYIKQHPKVKFFNASKTGAFIGGTLNYD